MVRLKCIAIVLCICLTPSAFGLSILFDPLSQSTNLGDQASVDVVLSQPGGVFVGAYDITVDYDATVLGLAGINFGSGLGGVLDSIQDSISSVGSVAVAEVSFLFDLSSVQSSFDDFVLFTLVFDALSVGTSALALSNMIVGDDFGAVLPVQASGGSVTVIQPTGPTPVPTPGTLLLLLVGVVALFRTRTKRVFVMQDVALTSERGMR